MPWCGGCVGVVSHDELVLAAEEMLPEEVVGFSSGSPVAGLLHCSMSWRPQVHFSVTVPLLCNIRKSALKLAGRNTTGELTGEVRYQ